MGTDRQRSGDSMNENKADHSADHNVNHGPTGISGWTPGSYVIHPAQPDWGVGQVQSAIGARVTVNFENAGKQTINTDIILLIPAP